MDKTELAQRIADELERQFVDGSWTGGAYTEQVDGHLCIELDGFLDITELVRRVLGE